MQQLVLRHADHSTDGQLSTSLCFGVKEAGFAVTARSAKEPKHTEV